MADSQTQSANSQPLIPNEVTRWNWGAFLLTWIWGIGNSVWVAFLTWIPVFGLIWMFVLGTKGSTWAWQKGNWRNIEHFKKVQHRWAIWGGVVWGVLILFFILMIWFVIHTLNNSAVTKASLQQINHSQEVARVLGSPIHRSSNVTGEINQTTSGGKATLKYQVRGPDGVGEVHVRAIKIGDRWAIIHLIVHYPNGNMHILIRSQDNN